MRYEVYLEAVLTPICLHISTIDELSGGSFCFFMLSILFSYSIL